MEKTQIVKYLHHPETMTEASLEKTRTLTVDYPWFQTGWVLYLKNLKNAKSPDFDSVLDRKSVV